MILFSEHLEDVNEQVDHVVVESNRTKYVVLITHLVLGVLAAVDWTWEGEEKKKKIIPCVRLRVP